MTLTGYMIFDKGNILYEIRFNTYREALAYLLKTKETSVSCVIDLLGNVITIKKVTVEIKEVE